MMDQHGSGGDSRRLRRRLYHPGSFPVVLFFSDSVGDCIGRRFTFLHCTTLTTGYNVLLIWIHHRFIGRTDLSALKRVTAMLISWYSDLVYGRECHSIGL